MKQKKSKLFKRSKKRPNPIARRIKDIGDKENQKIDNVVHDIDERGKQDLDASPSNAVHIVPPKQEEARCGIIDEIRTMCMKYSSASIEDICNLKNEQKIDNMNCMIEKYKLLVSQKEEKLKELMSENSQLLERLKTVESGQKQESKGISSQTTDERLEAMVKSIICQFVNMDGFPKYSPMTSNNTSYDGFRFTHKCKHSENGLFEYYLIIIDDDQIQYQPVQSKDALFTIRPPEYLLTDLIFKKDQCSIFFFKLYSWLGSN